MDSDEDIDFSALLRKMEDEEAQCDAEIARLKKEVERHRKIVAANDITIMQLNQEIEDKGARKEQTLKNEMKIESSLFEAGKLIQDLTEQLFVIEDSLPECKKVLKVVLEQVKADREKIDSLELDYNVCDFDGAYAQIEARLAEETERYHSRKEYYALETEKLERQIRRQKEDSATEKERLRSIYEPEIEKYSEIARHSWDRLQGEAEVEEQLKGEIAQKILAIEALEQRIGDVRTKIDTDQKSFSEMKTARTAELAEKQKELDTVRLKTQTTQSKINDLKSRSAALTQSINSSNDRREKVQARLRKKLEQRRLMEEETDNTMKDNAILAESVTELESRLSSPRIETGRKERDLKIKEEENENLKKTLLCNRQTFEEESGVRRKQLDELTTRASALEETLQGADAKKASLKATAGRNKTLELENGAIAEQNEHLEQRKNATEKKLLDANTNLHKLKEKRFEAFNRWTNDVASINHSIETKIALLETVEKGLASLENCNEKLSGEIAAEKALLAKQRIESEEQVKKVTEEYQRKWKAAKEDCEKMCNTKNDNESKYNDTVIKMTNKMTAKEDALSELQKGLSEEVKEYTKVQGNIAHLQELLSKTLEKDNKQVLRELGRHAKSRNVESSDYQYSSPNLSMPTSPAELTRRSQSSCQKNLQKDASPRRTQGREITVTKTHTSRPRYTPTPATSQNLTSSQRSSSQRSSVTPLQQRSSGESVYDFSPETKISPALSTRYSQSSSQRNSLKGTLPPPSAERQIAVTLKFTSQSPSNTQSLKGSQKVSSARTPPEQKTSMENVYDLDPEVISASPSRSSSSVTDDSGQRSQPLTQALPTRTSPSSGSDDSKQRTQQITQSRPSRSSPNESYNSDRMSQPLTQVPSANQSVEENGSEDMFG